MNDFHFLRPSLLFLIIPFVALLFLFFYRQKTANSWHRVCDKGLLPFILASKVKGSYFNKILSVITLLLLILALAGPSWNQITEPVFKRQSSLVIVLDLSESMNATDIKPSRLKRAIYKINDLLELRKDGQTALVVFSANPFVVTPLTDDVKTIQSQLPVLETTIMPSKGHRVDLGIAKALDLLKQTGVTEGSILLVTSTINPADLEKTLELVREANVKLSVLGVGGESTTPVSNGEGGFVKNANGSLMMTTLPVKDLKKLSDSTSGSYQTIALDDRDIQRFAQEFSAGFSDQQKHETEIGLKKWQDQGYLFVLLAIPLVSLMFRRGVLGLLLVVMPNIGEAGIWADYFETADKRGEELYRSEDYAEAKDTFENSDWKAACHYQLKEYNEAAEIYQQSNSENIEGLYNYGTARAKLGDFEKALAAYDKVLEIKPDHEDALFNKKVIEEYQQQQQEQNQDQQKDKDDKNKDKDDKNKDKDDKNKDKDGDKDNQDKEEEQQEQEPENQDNDKENEKENEELDEKDDEKDDEKEEEVAKEEESPVDEDQQKQIDERWLQHVKDDPGALLRRKFLQQYNRTKASTR